jgi:hypothetical protein
MKLNAVPPEVTASTRVIPQSSGVPLERRRALTTTTAKTGSAKSRRPRTSRKVPLLLIARDRYGTMTAAPSIESLLTAARAWFAWSSGKTVILGRRFMAAAI